jgi:hypothetical protein
MTIEKADSIRRPPTITVTQKIIPQAVEGDISVIRFEWHQSSHRQYGR